MRISLAESVLKKRLHQGEDGIMQWHKREVRAIEKGKPASEIWSAAGFPKRSSQKKHGFRLMDGYRGLLQGDNSSSQTTGIQ